MSETPPVLPPRPFWWPTGRDFVVATIFGLFAWGYGSAIARADHDAITGLNGVIQTAFAAAWGYYLGSSKGATENRDQLNRTTDKLTESATKP